MQKSILSELLKTLTSAEKTAFLRFVESPYFGAKTELVRLARQLLVAEGAPVRQNKTTVFPQIFGPERAYDDARMRKAMEQLVRLLEKFLVLQQHATEDFDYRLRLARLLAGRKQDKLLRRLLEAPLPFPANEENWLVEHFEQAAQWYQFVYDLRATRDREHDPALYQRITRYQTVAVLARRLRAACIFQSNRKEKDAPPADPLLDWPGQHLMENATFGKLPLLQTLWAGYRALLNPGESIHFEHFKTGLLEGSAYFSAADRRDLLLVAINFCSQRYNAGDKAYLDTQLDMYEHGLREGLWLENGWVTGYTFTNIGTLALIGRRYDRLEQFLRDFGEKVEPRYRESVVAFNRARLDHALGRYQPALALLQRDIFDDVLLNLSAKTVQAKCFFELDEYDLLDTHLEAMRKFIRRHKEVGYLGERYLNFTQVLRRIIRLPADQRPELQIEITTKAVLAEKDWLIGLAG